MSTNRTHVQAKSDEKRGIAKRGYSLPKTTIILIKSLSDQTGEPQGKIIAKAIELYAKKINSNNYRQ
ncbi:hypothetical protein [Acinetobacter sp. ESBL14]|uniref:hypothetical protein n=1 Tax=Acinetobacter sp. ESBL14 TaxID=3077329 RepID=UPI002FCC41B0